MAIAWLLGFDLSFVALGIAAGPSDRRRSHFWVRLAVVPVIAAGVLLPLSAVIPIWKMQEVQVLLAVLAVPVLMLVPPLLYRRPGPAPGHDDGDGGGPGPDEPSSPPPSPRGGIPLPDAEQARTRVRDHTGPTFRAPKPRRPAREPVRTPQLD